MKVVIAPNALKGSLSATDAAAALAVGVARVQPNAEIVQVPVADGGDGLLDVVRDVLGAESCTVSVTGPQFGPVEACFAWLAERRTAVIEMALASGLALLDDAERDATATTTVGTGELMRAALDRGAERLIIGIGGSATNDGGIGMASALGWRFLDAAGQPVRPVGGMLDRIARIDASGADPRLERVSIETICDVDNPLTGPRGAARVYAPQKGADADQVERLDAGLTRLGWLIQRDLGLAVDAIPGAGAAGGLGAGLLAFCGASLRPGAEVVLELVGLDRHLAGADLVLTAEGRIDGQTRFGKAPGAVAAHAAAKGIPCIAIAGGVGDDIAPLHDVGIDAVFSLCPGPITLSRAQAESADLLARAAEQVLRCFVAARR